MTELARFLEALYKELDHSFNPDPVTQQEALQLYQNFLADYPNSVYAKEAEFGFAAATYSLNDLLVPTLSDLPGALTIASDDADGSFSGNAFTLTGLDHTLAGQPAGSGNDAHGVFTTTAAAQQNLIDALQNNQRDNVTGVGPDPDIAQGDLDFDPNELIDTLLELVTDTLTTSPGGTLGSPEAPVVAYAPGGLTLSGNLSGTGVLIVDGSYSQRGSVAWTGLIVVRADAGTPPSFDLRGNVRLVGGALVVNETTQAASVSLQGSAEVLFSREAFEMLRTALFSTP